MRAAVIGHPIAHSLSPVLHRAAYVALGLAGWDYRAVDVAEPDLAGFLAGLTADWAGLSVTMPLKRAVRGFLDSESELAAQVGAVNTVVLDGGARCGDNTDVHGMVAALREAGAGPTTAAAVLGGGATAASALAAVRELGCREPVVHVRSATRASDLLAAAERLGVRPRLAGLDEAEVATQAAAVGAAGGVLVSTLPAGVADHLAAPIVAAALGSGRRAVLLDVVYHPWPTVLARSWAAAGGQVAGGFSMLVHQAGRQVELMTERQPPLELMRLSGQAELQRRQAG